jgi:hypothetical protein
MTPRRFPAPWQVVQIPGAICKGEVLGGWLKEGRLK